MNEEKKIIELNLGDILPNRFQPRIKFSEESINQLSESIKEHGVIQPIVVRKIGDKYEIIAGERRYKASVLAGRNFIPAIITDLNDKDSAEVALIENVQREDLTPIEEAISYKKILDMGYTQEQLAVKLGNKQSTIANKLRLLNLNEEVQEALLDEKISERHARSILRLNDSSEQSEILREIINKRLTVRKTDEEIDKMLNRNVHVIEDEVELLDTNIFSNPIIENSNISEGVGMMNEEKQNKEIESLNNALPLSSIDDVLKPKLDESSMEIFNIKPVDEIKLPSQPIIEEIETVEKSMLEPSPVIKEDDINPGFMNIEKIETEAKDIFEEKPFADVNSLLENDPSIPVKIEDETEEIEENDNPEKLLTPGKFFDILNEEVEEDNSIENFYQNAQPLNNINESVAFEPFMNPQVVEVPKTDQVDTNNIVEGSLKEENVFEPLTNPTSIEKIKAENEKLPLEPIFNPFIEEKAKEDEVVAQPAIVNSNIALDRNLKSVIDLVRECSKKIEKVGFAIELEEIDFEDTYQVIFKVYK